MSGRRRMLSVQKAENDAQVVAASSSRRLQQAAGVRSYRP